MKINIPKLAIWLFLISICRFFAIFKTSNIIYKSDLINLLVIILSALIILLCKFKPLLKSNPNNYIKKWIIIQLIFYFIECIYSTILYSQYGQNFISTISASFYVLSIISFFPLLYLQQKIIDVDYLKNTLKKVACIVAILSIVQVYLYNKGIVFLDIGDASFRYGTLRFCICAPIVSIAFIISLFDYFYSKKKENIFYIIVELICLFYAMKTRSEILYILLSIYFVSIFFLKNNSSKILMCFLGFVAVFVLVIGGFFTNFFSELLSDDGVNIRFETINFYMEQFKEKPLLGMGYIKTYLNPTLHSLASGNAGYYYRDDVGVIGLLNEGGIVQLILYIYLLKILFKMIFSLYKNDKKKNVWMLAIWIYILLCSINLVFLCSSQIAIFMIFCSMIYHYKILDENILITN